jgi:uridine kinase
MKREYPKTIAIAAISGGGKTTITKQLKRMLPNSKSLLFDEYDVKGPDDFIKWIESGGDPDEWDLSPLIRDIKELRRQALDYIILDYPFAYLHSQVSEFIDYAIFIDTPLDVAMARRLIRDHCNHPTENLLEELDFYINKGRPAYLHMLETIKPNSDLIVDGSLPINEIINFIREVLEKSD